VINITIAISLIVAFRFDLYYLSLHGVGGEKRLKFKGRRINGWKPNHCHVNPGDELSDPHYHYSGPNKKINNT